MVDEVVQGLRISEEELKANGIAAGSDAEKAILVDIAFAAKYNKSPEFQAKLAAIKDPEQKVKAIQEMIDDTIDGKHGNNPFVTDQNTKEIIKNYAHKLIKQSEEIDDKRQVEHGNSVETFLDRTSGILNGHEMLKDGKIENTITRASKGFVGAITGQGLSKDEADELVQEVKQVKQELDEPEHTYLGIQKGLNLRQDFNVFLKKDEAYEHTDHTGMLRSEAAPPKKDDFFGNALAAIEQVLNMLASLFSGKDHGMGHNPLAQQNPGYGGSNISADIAGSRTGGIV